MLHLTTSETQAHLFRGGEKGDVFVPLEDVRCPIDVELREISAEHRQADEPRQQEKTRAGKEL